MTIAINKNRDLAITGASGFIGRHLIAKLSHLQDLNIRLLLHSNTAEDFSKEKNIATYKGDLLNPESLFNSDFLKPGCTVINLVNLRSTSEKINLAAMNNLAVACRNARIKRLIHCSTAVVVGNIPDNYITEDTLCKPMPGYETIKHTIESMLISVAAGYFEVTVLRPTAVFGKGGKNLLKLVHDLKHGNRVVSYLKSCLFNHRRMNLVYVDNVVEALIFLMTSNRKMNNDIYIISDDDDPNNNYRDIEKHLMRYLGYRDYTIPRIPLPRSLLTVCLLLLRKPNVNPRRIYSSQKIVNAGFQKACSFEAGLKSFAEWYKESQNHPSQRYS